MLELEEIKDIEKANFLLWYRDATVEEIAAARRNNSQKLDELMEKYKTEISWIDIVSSPPPSPPPEGDR